MSDAGYWEDVSNAPARAIPELDDDGQALDSLVSPDAEPPTAHDAPLAPVDRLERVRVPALTRMQTRTTSLAPDVPYLIAGEDPWRSSLTLGPGADVSGTLRMAGSPSDCMNPLTSSRVFVDSTSSTAVSIPHTGAVYVCAADYISVSITVITKDADHA